MIKKFKTPWDVGALFICTKCGAKFNQPNLAEELKSELRRELKSQDKQTQLRVMPSGCLSVCYPEQQTFAYVPCEGPTEVYTTALEKETALKDISEFIKTKV